MPDASLRTIGGTSAKTIVSSRQLIIGDTGFADEEHPSGLKFSGIQEEATHDLIGGTRTSQSTGDFYDPISWGGNLWGDNVNPRVLSLNQMRVSGQEQRLKFLLERYDVKITNFTWEYHHRWWVEYSITVLVLRSASGNAPGKNAAGSADSMISTQAANAGLQLSTLSKMDPTAGLTFTDLPGITTAINASQPITQNAASIPGLLAQVNTQIAKAQQYLSNLPPNVVPAQFLAASSLVSSLTLIGANIASAQTTKTVASYGGDLFNMAATHFGDPSLFATLGQFNGVVADRLPPNVQTQTVIPPLVSTLLSRV